MFWLWEFFEMEVPSNHHVLRITLVLISMCAGLTAEVEAAVKIISPTENQIIKSRNQSVLFNCTRNSSSSSSGNFQWLKDDNEIQPVGRKDTPLWSSFELKNFSAQAEGNYVCIYGGSHASVIVRLASRPKARNIGERSPVLPTVDDSPQLQCEASGWPKPRIFWMRNNKSISEINQSHEYEVTPIPTQGESVSTVASELTIIGIQKEDSGIFSCVATNVVGEDKYPISVRVQDGPTRYKTTVKAAKPKYTAEVGEDAFLICVGEQVEDDVLTFLSWELNGKKLNTSNVHYRATNTFYDQKDGATPKVQMNLTIFDVDHSDEGNYSCVVHSDYVERASDSIILEVKESAPPDITHISDNQTVIQNDNMTLNCTADGDPPPDITWTKVSDNSVVTFPLTIKIEDEGYYRCTASNSIGSPATKDVFITVLYPPNINHISGNQTVNEGDEVTLNCTADGKPTPNITWTIRDIKKHFGSSFPLTITGKQDEGNYTCTADNGIGSQSDKVSVTVEKYHPINTKLTTPNLTVVLNESFTLTCSSQANPPAKYRFLREQQSLFTTTTGNNTAVYPTSVNERLKQVTYSCTPFNDLYGDGLTETITVTVLSRPLAEKPELALEPVCNGSFKSIPCLVVGYPEPAISWYKGNDTYGTLLEGESGKVLRRKERGCYTCYAENILGNFTVNSCFGYVPVNTSLPITLVVGNKECNNISEEKFIEKIRTNRELPRPVCPEFIKCKNGSAIIDLVLRFNQTVNKTYVFAVLKKAAAEGKFGDFVVDPESIKLTSQSSTASPSPSPTGTGTGGTQVPVCEETFLKNADCSTIVWKIVVLAIAGVVLIAIVAGIIAWWVHKRRKCRKDPRIHNSEERLHGNAEDNAYSQVNHGYAGTGPRPNGTEAVALQQRAAADGSDAAGSSRYSYLCRSRQV